MLEALIWECTEWRGSREIVDKIMAAVDRFATAKAEFLSAFGTPRGSNSHRPKPTQDQIDAAVDAIEKRVAAAPPKPKAVESTPMTMVMPRTCKACDEEKSLDDFTRDRTRADGYMSRCKKCVKEGVKIPRVVRK